MYVNNFFLVLYSRGVGREEVMSSTLVETVSINYEDFNESFLTCGTCLCEFQPSCTSLVVTNRLGRGAIVLVGL